MSVVMIAKQNQKLGRTFYGLSNLESLYIPVTETGCWLWLGAVNAGGYGDLGSKKYSEERLAHRLFYTRYVGIIPRGLLVLHKCDVTLCVNPNHLYVGTQKDNGADMSRRGRLPTRDRHWNRMDKNGISAVAIVAALKSGISIPERR